MIQALRWKFIRITMIAVFAVLLLIVSAVNAVNIYSCNQSLDSVTKMLLDNGGSFQKNPSAFDKMDYNDILKDPKDHFGNKAELPFSTRFFTVTTNNDGDIIRCNLSSIASVTESDLDEFVSAILPKNSSVGWYKSYRYRVGSSYDGYMLIIMEATSVRDSIVSVFAITSLVAVIAFAAVFILVALLSKHAIRPIAETYEKQKQFITDASHELKTPLTVISANTEILALTYGDNEWCEGIERQTKSMRELIGQMIQMSKLDEDEQKLVSERFNISDAVYDTALAFAPVAKKNGLNLEVSAAQELFVSGDEGKIRQVISILTDNAVKYCDAGGNISVNVCSGKYYGKERAVISVTNTFASVDSLNTEKIFERFYKEDKSRSASHSYGLGLPIARAIVEKHGGRLQAIKGDNCLEMKIFL